MKILCIDATASFLDFALRCEAAGHEVRVFMGPFKDGTHYTVGDGLLTKVKEWQSSMRWADLILLSDNVKYIKELESYRETGYPIFGPNMEGTCWELERGTGQDVLEDHGIKCIPSQIFKNYDEAIAFLHQNPEKRYVSKPTGDADKALSYVSKSSQDMMFMLEHWKRKQTKKVPFLFQEFTPGIEMAVGGWMGRNGFLSHFLENFEFKKLMNGEIGVNCYSADTEVLTKNGWKFWPDVTASDEICTLRDGEVQFEVPSRLTIADHDGELIGWESPYIDILVTPGHQMYVQDSHDRGDFWFESADITEKQKRKVLRTGGKWCGVNDLSALPEFYEGDFDAWCGVLGAYIADGSIHKHSVVFGNCPTHKQTVFIEIARKAGYVAKMYGSDLYINSKGLADHFRQFGKAQDKFVPQYVKSASKGAICSFLYGYESGDGNRRQGNSTFTTVSRQLSNDLQEMCLKVGWAANVKIRDRRDEKPHVVNGYTCYNRHIAYEVQVSKERPKANLTPEYCRREHYIGKVYCCTVTSHVIYVRRNGKACFLGQTGEMGTAMKYVKAEDSMLAQKVLLPLEAELIRNGYTGYIDVAVIIDKKGNPWPLEFTTRPGWPLFQIQQALHPDPCEWMLDCLNGKDTFKPFDDIAVGVVVTIPDFPYTKLTRKEVTGFPVWGITEKNRFNIHPCEMMLGEGPVVENGKIKTKPMLVTAGDYVLVTTGAEPTVSEARDAAYRVLKQLEIPNSPMYRTDIGDRLEKQLSELQSLGYATCWEW